MALATYTDLQSAIVGFSKRPDLAAQIPDFIALGEARIARDLRVRSQVVSTTLTCTPGSQTVVVPSDFLEAENITVLSSPPKPLHVVTPELMDEKFPAGYWTGPPTVYCYLGGNIQLGPTPDAAYSIGLDYYKRIPALSVTPTNWLLTNHPSIYLAAAMTELCLYTYDQQNLAYWDQKYQADSKSLQDADDRAVRSGSAMRVRTI